MYELNHESPPPRAIFHSYIMEGYKMDYMWGVDGVKC